MTWSKEDDRRLLTIAKNTRLTAVEISERLGRTPEIVRFHMKKLGLSPRDRLVRSGRAGAWNRKHAHLARRAMEYFLDHSFEETMARFGLSKKELRSLQTRAYQRPEFAHLRKDKRRHDVWSFDETMLLLKCAGLQPRQWIAKKLKRGTMQSVKEMVSRLRSNTRYINGLPKRLAEQLVGRDCTGFKVKAGPTAPGVDCRPIIVPWVIVYSEAKKSGQVPRHLLDALRVMSRFQKRVHGTRGINDTVASVQRVIRGRP